MSMSLEAVPDPAVDAPGLTEEAARLLTDEVKTDAAALWVKLLRLYEGGAHLALGYSSWGAYYEAEFDEHQSKGYRVLDAARVVDALGSPIGERPTESVARELVPVLKDDPERVTATWAAVVAEHGPEPTAKQVRDHVRCEPPQPCREPNHDATNAVLTAALKVSQLMKNGTDLRDPSGWALGDLKWARDEIDDQIRGLRPLTPTEPPARSGRTVTVAGVKFPAGGISERRDISDYSPADLKDVADDLIRRATPQDAAALQKVFGIYAQRAGKRKAPEAA